MTASCPLHLGEKAIEERSVGRGESLAEVTAQDSTEVGVLRESGNTGARDQRSEEIAVCAEHVREQGLPHLVRGIGRGREESFTEIDDGRVLPVGMTREIGLRAYHPGELFRVGKVAEQHELFELDAAEFCEYGKVVFVGIDRVGERTQLGEQSLRPDLTNVVSLLDQSGDLGVELGLGSLQGGHSGLRVLKQRLDLGERQPEFPEPGGTQQPDQVGDPIFPVPVRASLGFRQKFRRGDSA